MLSLVEIFRRRLLNFVPWEFLSLLSPLGKGLDPLLEQTWIPFTQRYFVPGLLEIGPVVLEKYMHHKIKNMQHKIKNMHYKIDREYASQDREDASQD